MGPGPGPGHVNGVNVVPQPKVREASRKGSGVCEVDSHGVSREVR